MKKKHLTWIGIIAAVVLAVVFLAIVLTGTFTVFPAGTINPIPDHAAGDLVVISGTTNLPAGTRFELDILPLQSDTGQSLRIGSTGAYIVPGTGLSNQWSGALDTTAIPPGEYIVNAYPVNATLTTYEKGNLIATARFRLNNSSTAPTGQLQQENQTPYISVNPPGNVTLGEKLLVTGTTNLPNDTELLYMVVQQSNISVFTIDPKTSCQDTQAGLTISGIIDVLPGTGGPNRWSFAIDTAEFIPDRYEVSVSTFEDNMTARTIDIGNISGSSQLIVKDAAAKSGV